MPGATRRLPGAARPDPGQLREVLAGFRDRVGPSLLRLLDEVDCPGETGPRLRASIGLLVAGGDPAGALPLEDLERTLSDLGVLFVSRFAYSGRVAPGPRAGRRPIEVEMDDRGGGYLVSAAIAHVGMIAICAHGAPGLAAARRSRSRLDDLIGEIAERMRPHLED